MADHDCQVVVLVSCYNGMQYIDDCLNSVLASDATSFQRHIVVVDDASTDGSADHIRQQFPQVDCVRLATNRGFAGANNAGYEHIKQNCPNAKYLFLLNMDTVADTAFLSAMVEHMDQNENVAAAQSKLLLHDSKRINTAGNRSHYLGFGFMTGFNEEDTGQYEARPIDFASGAAMTVRMSAIEKCGLFDESFFMYLEDADLSWKLRSLGHKVTFVPDSIVEHKYEASAPTKYYFQLERNRWILLLTYYRLPTLILLLPALLFMELGQVAFSLINGTLGAKFRAWFFFWNPKYIGAVLRRRSNAQKTRRIGDRELTKSFSGTVDFEAIDSPLLKYVGNPILGLYWAIVRCVIVW